MQSGAFRQVQGRGLRYICTLSSSVVSPPQAQKQVFCSTILELQCLVPTETATPHQAGRVLVRGGRLGHPRTGTVGRRSKGSNIKLSTVGGRAPIQNRVGSTGRPHSNCHAVPFSTFLSTSALLLGLPLRSCCNGYEALRGGGQEFSWEPQSLQQSRASLREAKDDHKTKQWQSKRDPSL